MLKSRDLRFLLPDEAIMLTYLQISPILVIQSLVIVHPHFGQPRRIDTVHVLRCHIVRVSGSENMAHSGARNEFETATAHPNLEQMIILRPATKREKPCLLGMKSPDSRLPKCPYRDRIRQLRKSTFGQPQRDRQPLSEI